MAGTVADPYPSLTISLLRAHTPAPKCSELADFLYGQFMGPASPGVKYGRYQDACSIIVLSGTFEEYFNGPAGYATRRKVRRAEKSGYKFAEIEHDQYLDDIHAVNTSLAKRQGRPMDDSYQTRPQPLANAPASTCPQHREICYGVLRDGHVVAYTFVYMVGEMCLFSRILGHGEHLENGVMYQLVARVIEDLIGTAGLRYAMYERHTSGTPGLRFFKERMGFRPYWVDWQLAYEAVESNRRHFDDTAAASRSPAGLARRAARKAKRTATKLLGRA
jgi:hypothetical protein